MSEEKWTLFAPTDDAFNKLGDALDGLSENATVM
jgi:uncharacterized surface protein with fasciclin (FAS1) repeats